MKLIGIGGTNGSGKDALAEILEQDYGWLFISVSDILRDELKRRKLAIERKHLRDLSAEWRREHHHGFLIDQAINRYRAKANGDGLVISSLRNPGEADRIHELGGWVVWVDADPKIRYQRVYSRRRSSEDHKTFEQFVTEENEEMEYHKQDKATLNTVGVKAKADIFITNDSDNLDDFKRSIGQSLQRLI